MFVPLSAADGLVAGVTVDEVLVDRLGAELPGSLFHAPTSRWVFDVAGGALLTASAVGDRAQVTWTGRPPRGGARDGGGAAGGAEADVAVAEREAAFDWRVVSWQRPRWRGDGVLAADPVSMLLHPTTGGGGGGGGGAAPPRAPPPAVGGDPLGAWHRFMDRLVGWFGNASIAAVGGGAFPRAGVPPTAPAPAHGAPVTTVSHTEASSYCVVRRLGAVALGATPVRAVRLRLPPPANRDGGGGGDAAAPTDGAARGARRRPVRRRRGPIPVDTVDDPVVRDRVLRNRESARRSNERRRAATAAARSATASATTTAAAASVVAARVGAAAPRGGGAAALGPPRP
ncbi:hypothetical protein BU14_0023s0076 [Porphyra umbilicalis]|uniref:BZIP domain-containing protein n=1 Tax=Porphyra umbilicalis TaxID=2786 RepID=A0A1X6PK96_PORUM|nr:hypothetical protein BU14_0023s0076 [Porphyra umbilicalis]|eukprot:OSX81272.1 hypothetical protein BU14_0023s0076 [Porphyra umbilicalis]